MMAHIFTASKIGGALLLASILTIYKAEIAPIIFVGLGLGLLYLTALAGVGLSGRITKVRYDSQLRAAEVERARKQAQQAQIITAPYDHQVFVNGGQTWRALHLAPSSHINGRPSAFGEQWQVWHMSHSKRQPDIVTEQPPQLVEPAPVSQDIVSLLANEYRLLIRGASGSGKTSLLYHVVNTKLGLVDRVILCDPHGSRPRWGADIDSVGFGENYGDIIETLQSLEWLHAQRIQQIATGARGEREFPTVLCILEELQALTYYCKKAKIDITYYINMLLTRTRKTAIDVVIVTQADTVKALGIEGFGQNKEALAMAQTVGRESGAYSVNFTTEQGNTITFPAPPLWPASVPVGVGQDKILQLPPPPSDNDRRIVELKRAGLSHSAICQEIWGARGPSRYEAIDRAWSLFGDDRWL